MKISGAAGPEHRNPTHANSEPLPPDTSHYNFQQEAVHTPRSTPITPSHRLPPISTSRQQTLPGQTHIPISRSCHGCAATVRRSIDDNMRLFSAVALCTADDPFIVATSANPSEGMMSASLRIPLSVSQEIFLHSTKFTTIRQLVQSINFRSPPQPSRHLKNKSHKCNSKRLEGLWRISKSLASSWKPSLPFNSTTSTDSV